MHVGKSFVLSKSWHFSCKKHAVLWLSYISVKWKKRELHNSDAKINNKRALNNRNSNRQKHFETKNLIHTQYIHYMTFQIWKATKWKALDFLPEQTCICQQFQNFFLWKSQVICQKVSQWPHLNLLRLHAWVLKNLQNKKTNFITKSKVDGDYC